MGPISHSFLCPTEHKYKEKDQPLLFIQYSTLSCSCFQTVLTRILCLNATSHGSINNYWIIISWNKYVLSAVVKNLLHTQEAQPDLLPAFAERGLINIWWTLAINAMKEKNVGICLSWFVRMDFRSRHAPSPDGHLLSVKAGDRARQSPEWLTAPRKNEQPPLADGTAGTTLLGGRCWPSPQHKPRQQLPHAPVSCQTPCYSLIKCKNTEIFTQSIYIKHLKVTNRIKKASTNSTQERT